MNLFDEEKDLESEFAATPEESSLSKYMKESDNTRNTKNALNAAGSVLQGFADVPTGYEMIYGKKIAKANPKEALSQAASMVEDPAERKKKAYEYLKLKNEGIKMNEETGLMKVKKDPNSVQSKAAKQLASKYGIPVTPEMSAYDVEQMMDPKKMRETEAQSSVNFANQKELAKINHGYNLAEAKAKVESAGTVGQKKVDEDYAKHYNQFTGKGKVNAEQTIKQLNELKRELDTESKEAFQAGGGRLGSLLPDQMRATDSLRWKSEIPAKANLVLKELFGGQLSDGERDAEAKTYYNDLLPPKENSRILNKKIDTLIEQLRSEDAKAKYYQANGTLRGFEGGVGQGGSGLAQTPSSPKDQQAIQWALNNPSDPRSKQILKQNGVDPETMVGAR